MSRGGELRSIEHGKEVVGDMPPVHMEKLVRKAILLDREERSRRRVPKTVA